MIDLDALEARARAVLPKPRFPRNPHGPALQCPKCGGHHYICSSSDERQAERDYLDATGAESTLALIARIRELETERAIVKRFMQMVWRWCNRPNVTDAERLSFIRNHPTLERFVEPPDDAYRDGVPEAARISKEAADGK